MGIMLKFVGGTCLILSFFGLVASLIIVFGVSVKSPDAVGGVALALFGSLWMIWVWAGIMVVGCILYVGGRALQYMDGGNRHRTPRQASRPRQRRRTAGRPRR